MRDDLEINHEQHEADRGGDLNQGEIETMLRCKKLDSSNRSIARNHCLLIFKYCIVTIFENI